MYVVCVQIDFLIVLWILQAYDVKHYGLSFDLHVLFPSMEYLLDAGWIPGGQGYVLADISTAAAAVAAAAGVVIIYCQDGPWPMRHNEL